MLDPPLVARIVREMCRRVTHTKVTVKCRIGVTGRDSFEELVQFVDQVRLAGVSKVVVHARCCVLRGLSPAQNRSVPPLHPEVVVALTQRFPDMRFVLNGGVSSFSAASEHLQSLHGVMIGREAYRNPWSSPCAISLRCLTTL